MKQLYLNVLESHFAATAHVGTIVDARLMILCCCFFFNFSKKQRYDLTQWQFFNLLINLNHSLMFFVKLNVLDCFTRNMNWPGNFEN